MLKEECLAHVSKQLKKTLTVMKKILPTIPTFSANFSEPKADYISSNYLTVILQNRGKSPVDLYKGQISFYHTSVGFIPPVLMIHAAVGIKPLTLISRHQQI